MSSLPIERVLLLENVFSCLRKCPLALPSVHPEKKEKKEKMKKEKEEEKALLVCINAR